MIHSKTFYKSSFIKLAELKKDTIFKKKMNCVHMYLMYLSAKIL